MGLLNNAAVFSFNVLLVLCTLLVYLIAKVSVLSGKCWALSEGSYRRKAVLVSACLAWRFVLVCSFWLRFRIDGLKDFRRQFAANGRPTILLANHASFMDTILLVTCMPVSKITKIKMLVSSHLLSMPFLGTIVEAMGHKAVPFKQGASGGSFELDKELMAKRQQEMEAHVAAGGIGAWYPEGTMNRGDTREAKTFRAGGFALAKHVDVEIWCVAMQGPAVCWPHNAAAGGRPARIGVKIFKVCDSSHALVASGIADPNDERMACLHLAQITQDKVQKGMSQLNEEGYGVQVALDTGKSEARKPLLPWR